MHFCETFNKINPDNVHDIQSIKQTDFFLKVFGLLTAITTAIIMSCNFFLDNSVDNGNKVTLVKDLFTNICTC